MDKVCYFIERQSDRKWLSRFDSVGETWTQDPLHAWAFECRMGDPRYKVMVLGGKHVHIKCTEQCYKVLKLLRELGLEEVTVTEHIFI